MSITVSTAQVVECVEARSGIARRLCFALAFVVIVALWCAQFLQILKLNQGTFVYTMDDPYTHLALSDQIRHGNYGLFAGTHSAPASSILFAFLLAPASGTPVHPYIPLILNTAAMFATMVIVRRFLLLLKLPQDDFASAVQASALVLIAIFVKVLGLVFTGMEHSLQLLVVAAILYLLARLLERGEFSLWLPVLLVVSPLVRYEGVPLSLAAMLVLAARGYKRAAAGAFAAMVLCLGLFSAYLMSLGLPPLPSSVMVKSAVASQGVAHSPLMLFAATVFNIIQMGRHPVGLVLLVIGIYAAARCALMRRVPLKHWSGEDLMSIPLLFVICGHALAGRFGYLERYELYAVLATLLLALFMGRDFVRSALANRADRSVYISAAAAALIVLGGRYAWSTLQVPYGANNIYEQQYQMRRFVHDFYRQSVAVNDIGLISYKNPSPVLDLWGLGSEKARLLKEKNADAAAYRDLLAASGVHLAIIYDEWFAGHIPSEWQKVATMQLSRAHVTAYSDQVQFYATDVPTASAVRAELKSFRMGLPAGVRLTIYESPSAFQSR